MTEATPTSNWQILSLTQDYPDVTAVAVLLIGLALAFIVSRSISRFYARIGEKQINIGSQPIELGSFASRQTARRIVFWIILLVTMLIALRLLSVDSFGNWRELAVEYGTRGLFGAIILSVGLSLGALVRDLTFSISQTQEANLFARFLQYTIVTFAFITAFDQLGFNVSLLTTAISILVGITAGALALSFALGSRDYVANLLARSELERINVGDRIRIDQLEGLVTRMHKSGIEIVTDQGSVAIPAGWLINQPYVKLTVEDDD